MVFISGSDRHLVIGFNGQLLVITRSADSSSEQTSFQIRSQSLPEIRPEVQNKKFDEKNRVRDDSPICGTFSRCGQLFAVADCYKRLFVWRTSGSNGDSLERNESNVSWELHREFRLDRRPVAVQFVDGQNDLLGMQNIITNESYFLQLNRRSNIFD
jgi:hypothetical protein